MTIFIGADHGGFELKEKLKPWLSSLGHEVVDCGNTVLDPVDDFPDFSFVVAKKVALENGSRGIVICRSGGGVAIAANKVRGIRCVIGINEKDVTHNRAHSDVNMLAISADYTDEETAKKLIETFLNTPFDGGERFVRRIGKIRVFEEKST
ncbi:RpiB/LacA/LacB family sugar-phosphate isomerase [Candidatus Gottesmanbacteria bacterium]|nr:RpiB/LacA/LacB family sugar-phosphate isomerase [Candidatus Gottesmanbacteria bacterium]